MLLLLRPSNSVPVVQWQDGAGLYLSARVGFTIYAGSSPARHFPVSPSRRVAGRRGFSYPDKRRHLAFKVLAGTLVP